jgi:hypothetical protein
MARPDYHPFIPTPAQSKIAGPNARAHAQAKLLNPRAQELFGGWDALFAQPFKGITTDGSVIPDLYRLMPNGAPTAAIVEAATALLACLSPQRQGLRDVPRRDAAQPFPR